MIVKAYAKINLSLDITGKREDGYHTLDTVMQTVSLYDEIDLTKNKEGDIRLSCTRMSLPIDERNTAYRAARLMLRLGNIEDMGVNIHISKEIPSEAGLGGGSADAAAVLRGMNELFRMDIKEEKLLELAAQIGADVPFCLKGGTRRCMGIGEIMSTSPGIPHCYILICKPPVGVSTPYAYEESDKYPQDGYFLTPYLSDALKAGDLFTIAENLGNRFDDILQLPEVQIIKGLMLEQGALNACMTGSGSAVFGVFTDAEKAKSTAEQLQELGQVFLTEPVSSIK